MSSIWGWLNLWLWNRWLQRTGCTFSQNGLFQKGWLCKVDDKLIYSIVRQESPVCQCKNSFQEYIYTWWGCNYDLFSRSGKWSLERLTRSVQDWYHSWKMRVPRFKSRADTKACALNYCAYGVQQENHEQVRSHTPTYKKAHCTAQPPSLPATQPPLPFTSTQTERQKGTGAASHKGCPQLRRAPS